jgi:hypothetical protein
MTLSLLFISSPPRRENDCSDSSSKNEGVASNLQLLFLCREIVEQRKKEIGLDRGIDALK